MRLKITPAPALQNSAEGAPVTPPKRQSKLAKFIDAPREAQREYAAETGVIPPPQGVVKPTPDEVREVRERITGIRWLPEVKMAEILAIIAASTEAQNFTEEDSEAPASGPRAPTAKELLRPQTRSQIIATASGSMLAEWDRVNRQLEEQPKVMVMHSEPLPLPITINGYPWGVLQPNQPTAVPESIAAILANRLELLQGVERRRQIMMEARQRGLTLRDYLVANPKLAAEWGDYPVTPD